MQESTVPAGWVIRVAATEATAPDMKLMLGGGVSPCTRTGITVVFAHACAASLTTRDTLCRQVCCAACSNQAC